MVEVDDMSSPIWAAIVEDFARRHSIALWSVASGRPIGGPELLNNERDTLTYEEDERRAPVASSPLVPEYHGSRSTTQADREEEVAHRDHPVADGCCTDPRASTLRVCDDPLDAAALHAQFRRYRSEGDADRALCVANVLDYLEKSTVESLTYLGRHWEDGLVRPTATVTPDEFAELLRHPEEDASVSAVMSIIAPTLSQLYVETLRRARKVSDPPAEKKQNLGTTTARAARTIAWAATLLGLPIPVVYADPDFELFIESLPAVRPTIRLGLPALSGRTATELAFVAGREVALHHQDHSLITLFPSPGALEKVFFAALTLGTPSARLVDDDRSRRAAPLARALRNALAPSAVELLRERVEAFIAEGRPVDLCRWRDGVEKTATRAGFLVAADLNAARAILEEEERLGLPVQEARMDDLLRFCLSDNYGHLRRSMGIATLQSRCSLTHIPR